MSTPDPIACRLASRSDTVLKVPRPYLKERSPIHESKKFDGDRSPPAQSASPDPVPADKPESTSPTAGEPQTSRKSETIVGFRKERPSKVSTRRGGAPEKPSPTSPESLRPKQVVSAYGHISYPRERRNQIGDSPPKQRQESALGLHSTYSSLDEFILSQPEYLNSPPGRRGLQAEPALQKESRTRRVTTSRNEPAGRWRCAKTWLEEDVSSELEVLQMVWEALMCVQGENDLGKLRAGRRTTMGRRRNQAVMTSRLAHDADSGDDSAMKALKVWMNRCVIADACRSRHGQGMLHRQVPAVALASPTGIN